MARRTRDDRDAATQHHGARVDRSPKASPEDSKRGAIVSYYARGTHLSKESSVTENSVGQTLAKEREKTVGVWTNQFEGISKETYRAWLEETKGDSNAEKFI